ncbi:MAG TPA: flagellin [Bryobacteraceae bacterium]|nr:flagellin [Bryobacteraceae bacterium]
MIRTISSGSEKFLADMSRIAASTDRAQRQLSSGLRVEQPSDGPDQVSQILRVRASLAQVQSRQENLADAKTLTDTAEQALQSAVQVIERASVLASQAVTGTADADSRQAIVQEVQALQQQLVGLSQTSIAGRYVFSGDQDQSPAYSLDTSQPNGVERLLTAPATRQIEDATGMPFVMGRTAQEIFDHRNADDTLADDNVFAALQTLSAALANNDEDGLNASVSALACAGDYLNQQLAFYGAVQNRIAASTTQADQLVLQHKAQLSSLEDADLTSAILELQQSSMQQEAALAAQAQAPRTSLFDFLK